MCKDDGFPRRPYIPTTLYALVAVIATQRTVLGEGRCWTSSRSWVVATGAGLLLVLASLGLAKVRHPAWSAGMVVAAALVAGGATACIEVAAGERFVQAMSSTPVSATCIRILGDPIPREDSFRCRAEVICPTGPIADVWLRLPEEVGLGTTIRCTGVFQKNADDEWGVSSRMQGIWGSVRVFRVVEQGNDGWMSQQVQRIRGAILGMLDPLATPERALLAGCACGWRKGLVSFGLDKKFSQCGLSHLVAVSGSHLAILSAIFAGLMEAMRIRPHVRTLALVVVTGSFVLLCGSPPSAVRAWVMACAAMVGRMGGRRSHALSAVCVAGLCMALLSPGVSGQLGFTLSVSAVVGLCMLSSYAAYVLGEALVTPKLPKHTPKGLFRAYARFGRACREALAASMVAQVATLPFVVDSFGEVSLVGPLASMVVTMPFSALMGIAAVGIACWWAPPMQAMALWVADVFAHAVLMLVEAIGRLPFAMVTTSVGSFEVLCVVGLGVVALLVAWPRVSGRALRVAAVLACALICMQLIIWRFFAPARLCVLDVGQGDAILVQQAASAVLVDAGPSDAVLDALARNHVTHLDAVVLTHMHDDHYGGLSSLEGRVRCDRVLVARGVMDHIPPDLEQAWSSLARFGISQIGFGDVLHVGAFDLEVLWPDHEVDGSKNSDSLQLGVGYAQGGATLHGLLTGDAEREEAGALLEAGRVGNIDFLKVGHHGSEVSITKDQAARLDPEIAVASAGKNNRYGHPNASCVEALEYAGATFLCTMDVGDVEVMPAEGGVVVSTQRPPMVYP